MTDRGRVTTRVEVKAIVDIPPFLALGRRWFDDRTLVQLDDVCAYLTTVAAAFDRGGANRDIGMSVRAIRDGLADARVEVIRV